MTNIENRPTNFKLLSNLTEQINQTISVATDGEIVTITGTLHVSGARLIYNPFFSGYEILQLEPEFYPDHNLCFLTKQKYLLLASGRLLLLSVPKESLCLTGIIYSRAFGMRLSLTRGWLPLHNSFRYPSVYITERLVVLSGVLTDDHTVNDAGIGPNANFNRQLFSVLPLGYRPMHRQSFLVSAGKQGKGRVDVFPSGNCYIWTNNKYASLDGVRYLSQPQLPPIRQLSDYLQVPLSLNQQWRNYSSEYQPLTLTVYFPWIIVNGQVKLVKSDPNNQVIATFPVKYAPSQDLIFYVDNPRSSTELSHVKISTDGKITASKNAVIVPFPCLFWRGN